MLGVKISPPPRLDRVLFFVDRSLFYYYYFFFFWLSRACLLGFFQVEHRLSIDRVLLVLPPPSPRQLDFPSRLLIPDGTAAKSLNIAVLSFKRSTSYAHNVYEHSITVWHTHTVRHAGNNVFDFLDGKSISFLPLDVKKINCPLLMKEKPRANRIRPAAVYGLEGVRPRFFFKKHFF